MNAAQIKDEIRKLNRSGKCETRRSFADIAAIHLLARIGVPEPSAIRYRVVVGRAGIVFDGYSSSEAQVQFRIFVDRSKTAKSRLEAGSVLLFRDAEIMREYHSSGFGFSAH
jgi:hypothetical protein